MVDRGRLRPGRQAVGSSGVGHLYTAPHWTGILSIKFSDLVVWHRNCFQYREGVDNDLRIALELIERCWRQESIS